MLGGSPSSIVLWIRKDGPVLLMTSLQRKSLTRISRQGGSYSSLLSGFTTTGECRRVLLILFLVGPPDLPNTRRTLVVVTRCPVGETACRTPSKEFSFGIRHYNNNTNNNNNLVEMPTPLTVGPSNTLNRV